MDEYISREAILDNLEEEIEASNVALDEDVWINKGLRIAIRDIKDAKSADVQLVKRGKWKQIAPQSAICSECGGALKSNGIDKTGKAYIFNAVYKYCPYCGARMDGDAE
jgi:hypothetical protein